MDSKKENTVFKFKNTNLSYKLYDRKVIFSSENEGYIIFLNNIKEWDIRSDEIENEFEENKSESDEEDEEYDYFFDRKGKLLLELTYINGESTSIYFDLDIELRKKIKTEDEYYQYVLQSSKEIMGILMEIF